MAVELTPLMDGPFVEPLYDSAVGIASRYGLDVPVIESWWGRDFLHRSRPALRPTPASYTMGTGSFLGVKRLGRDVDHPPPLAPRLKKV